MTGNSHDQAALDSVVKNLPACIFLIQGSNSWLLHWQMDFFFFFFTTEPPRKLHYRVYILFYIITLQSHSLLITDVD